MHSFLGPTPRNPLRPHRSLHSHSGSLHIVRGLLLGARKGANQLYISIIDKIIVRLCRPLMSELGKELLELFEDAIGQDFFSESFLRGLEGAINMKFGD